MQKLQNDSNKASWFAFIFSSVNWSYCFVVIFFNRTKLTLAIINFTTSWFFNTTHKKRWWDSFLKFSSCMQIAFLTHTSTIMGKILGLEFKVFLRHMKFRCLLQQLPFHKQAQSLREVITNIICIKTKSTTLEQLSSMQYSMYMLHSWSSTNHSSRH